MPSTSASRPNGYEQSKIIIGFVTFSPLFCRVTAATTSVHEYRPRDRSLDRTTRAT